MKIFRWFVKTIIEVSFSLFLTSITCLVFTLGGVFDYNATIWIKEMEAPIPVGIFFAFWYCINGNSPIDLKD